MAKMNMQTEFEIVMADSVASSTTKPGNNAILIMVGYRNERKLLPST